MLTATICLRADTRADFDSVLAIIKESGLPVSIEEVILHQEESRVKAPSVVELNIMVESWKKKPQVILGHNEEEHF